MVSPQDQSAPLWSAILSNLSGLSRSALVTWVAALAFIAILIGGWLHTKATIENQLRENVLAMAQLAAERAALTFDGVSQVLQTVGDDIEAGGVQPARRITAERRQALQTTLAQTRVRNPNVSSLVLTDVAGEILAASPEQAARSVLTMRPIEAPAIAQPTPGGPALSAAFRDPATGNWSVRVAYRIGGPNNPNGAGQLLAVVALDAGLMKFVEYYPFGERDVIALHDTSDRQLAIFPGNRPVTEKTQSATTGNAVAAESVGAVRYAASPVGDSAQIVATRRLPRYPFYVVYGKSVDAWLARWRQEQFVLALAAMAALVVTAAVTTGIQRRLVLTAQLQQVRGDLEETNGALRTTLAVAESLAAKDQLTGLWNRRNLDQRLEGSIAHSTRCGGTFSLLLIDIDNFKQVNDYFGHITGDDVLKRFGEVLSERLRQNDVAARWGGEEFVILADGTNLERARVMAEQIREAISATPFSPVPRITVSIGIAEYQNGETGDDLLKRADKALYGAKRNGRNRVIAAESGNTPALRSA